MKCTIKKHGFSYVLVITDYVKMYKLNIGDVVEVRINRVSSGSHPLNKQKPLIIDCENLSKKEISLLKKECKKQFNLFADGAIAHLPKFDEKWVKEQLK